MLSLVVRGVHLSGLSLNRAVGYSHRALLSTLGPAWKAVPPARLIIRQAEGGAVRSGSGPKAVSAAD